MEDAEMLEWRERGEMLHSRMVQNNSISQGSSTLDCKPVSYLFLAPETKLVGINLTTMLELWVVPFWDVPWSSTFWAFPFIS